MSVFSYCSTIPTFWRIVKKKSVEGFSDHPYLFSLLNGLLWTFYGYLTLRRGGLFLLTVNAIGCAFQYAYLAFYILFATTHKQRMITGTSTGIVHLLFLMMVILVKFFLKQYSIQLRVMGTMSCMAAIVMYGAPLSIMATVIYTKSVEYMPFLLSLALTLRSGTWCAFGYVTHDIYVEVTNTIGVLLGVSQLILYTIYCKKTPRNVLKTDTMIPADMEACRNTHGLHNSVNINKPKDFAGNPHDTINKGET
ncbi:hypothetical protein KP509_24G040500 [Ceratopteris richardii]|nr:hypothetical protein KP509_24G040500 [Ceratopteris richardii]